MNHKISFWHKLLSQEDSQWALLSIVNKPEKKNPSGLSLATFLSLVAPFRPNSDFRLIALWFIICYYYYQAILIEVNIWYWDVDVLQEDALG